MFTFPPQTGTVVVGCDGSWESQHAVVAATREAARRGTRLVLLTVSDRRPYWPDSLSWVSRIEAEAAETGRGIAERAMARAVDADPAVPLDVAFAKDFSTEEVHEVARAAGLLVLGRRGAGGQVAFSLGSTSGELTRLFHCPVLVSHANDCEPVEPPPDRPAAVVVGMDTTRSAARVLRVAAAEAVARGCSLIVVHAVPQGARVDGEVLSEDWDRARKVLESAHLPRGVPNRLVVTQDTPVAALLSRVGPQDLLVVGTRGQGRLAGLVEGSVSRGVLDDMRCDVMVVPPRLDTPTPSSPAMTGSTSS